MSPALLDAMQRRPTEPAQVGIVPAGVDEPPAVEEVDYRGSVRVRVLVEGPLVIRHPTIAPPRYAAEGLPAKLRQTAVVHAAVEALPTAVDQVDGEPGRDAAAAAWQAESVVQFFCSTYAATIVAVRVNEDSFIVTRAEVPADDVIDVTIAVGPDGTCACRVSTTDGHLASAAPDVRAFE